MIKVKEVQSGSHKIKSILSFMLLGAYLNPSLLKFCTRA